MKALQPTDTKPEPILPSANEEYFQLYGAKLHNAICFLRRAPHRNYSIYILDKIAERIK